MTDFKEYDVLSSLFLFAFYTKIYEFFFLKNIFFHFLKYRAIVWGSSVKHNPQKVGKDHVLNDEDVVQILKKC